MNNTYAPKLLNGDQESPGAMADSTADSTAEATPDPTVETAPTPLNVWEILLKRDAAWCHALVQKSNQYRRRQYASLFCTNLITSQIKEAIFKTQQLLKRQRERMILANKKPTITARPARPAHNKKPKRTKPPKTTTTSKTLSFSPEMHVTSSAGDHSWVSMTIRHLPPDNSAPQPNTKAHLASSTNRLNDPYGTSMGIEEENGHLIYDVLHSSKYLYLCVSWCMRTSYHQLMIRNYLNSMHAFHQPPLALQVLLEHLTIRQRGDLETINGAIPEPFIRTSEALLALLGQHDTEPAWRRPLLKSARAAHAWKWMRRMMFGNYSTFLALLTSFDPKTLVSTGTRISRARKALEHDCFSSKQWLLLNQTEGCLVIELFRRWALAVVRYAQAQNIKSELMVMVDYYTKVSNDIELGLGRGIGVGVGL